MYVLALLVFVAAGGVTGQPGTPVKMVIAQEARALPLSDVRLTGGPLKHAQDLNGACLLALEPDRMMAFLRKSAGLDPKADGYGGWDGPGRQLTGHIAGHSLSGVSLMWAATGDPRYKERADYLVAELKAVQDKQGDGYIGAQADKDGADAKALFQALAKGTIRSGGFDLNGLWSPWYVLHKIYAGLGDAYRYTGNRTALDVEVKYAAWAERILAGLADTQIQQMLATEFGGMNEVMADLYADTGDKRWLAASDRFEHRAIMWGLLVLAGDLGPIPPRAGRGSGAAAQTPPPAPLTVPVLVTPERSVSKWLTPVAARPGVLTTTGIGRDRDVEFVPFYRLHHRVYGAYWDLLTPDQGQARSTAIRAAQDAQRTLDAATVAFVQPGQMQTERDFNQQGENSTPVQFEGRYGRHATSWFSFDLPVDQAHLMVLVVTYNRDERQRRAFDILVDGVKIGEQAVERRSPQEKTGFFDVAYRVPTGLIQGRQKLTVRFQGTEGSEVGAVYGLRMIPGS